MKKNLITAVLMTIATTVLLGILYPLLVTGLAQLIFPKQANGQLIKGNEGVVVGSRLIGQPFSGPGYFHSRPSAAGAAGYDASASGGSNLGPTNAQLIARVSGDVAKLQAENPGVPIPVDLITTSGSGLELKVIASVVIGGGSLNGGRGSVLGTLTGALIMSVITSGCTALGLTNPIQDMILGIIIVAAVTIDQLRQRKQAA